MSLDFIYAYETVKRLKSKMSRYKKIFIAVIFIHTKNAINICIRDSVVRIVSNVKP